jgi:hypothetical protein
MRIFASALLAGALAGIVAAPAFAADPCGGFKWDVAREHALFQGSATSLQAGKDAASAPSIATDRLYELQLSPQDTVNFVLPPGKKMLSDGAYAGLAAFAIHAPGAYRVSVDVPFWIDVIVGGKLTTTKDFQGQQGCDAPHKIVEYDLTDSQPLVLQVSGATKAAVRLTITRSPGPKS